MDQEKERRDATVGMFVSYCRKTIVNARTDVLRQRARRTRRETLFSEMSAHEVECLKTSDRMGDEEKVFSALGHPIGVQDTRVADALLALDEVEQTIVLLSYFAGWSDRRIGEDLSLPRSTVQCRRARALSRMSAHLREGGGRDEGWD